MLRLPSPCRGVFAAISLLALSACTGEPPPTPPADLTPFDSRVSTLRIWVSDIGQAGSGLFEPLVLPSDDTADPGQVIVANRRGRVVSYGLDNGMRQWQVELDQRLSSGVGGSDALVFVSDQDANVYALNPDNGELLWQTRASSEVTMPVTAGFGQAALRSADGRVVVLSLDDGQERWTLSNPPPSLSLNGYSRPLILDGGVLLGLDDGRVLALSSDSGDVIWETVLSEPRGRSEVERLVDIDADIVVDDQGIYVAGYQGRIARLEPARGNIVWSEPVSAGSGLVLNATDVVVVDENDTVISFDRASGRESWRNDTMLARRLSAPGLTPKGDIVVGDVEGYLHVLSAADGQVIGRTRHDNKPIAARPLLSDDAVLVLSAGGKLAAYRFPE